MNQAARTFVLIGLVVVIMLAMHLLPAISVGDRQLRGVNMLSDVWPEVEHRCDIPSVLDVPGVPDELLAADTLAAADSTTVQPQVPEGVTMILDYSRGEAGGMQHFYGQLAAIGQLERPVRVAYYGDSFVEGDIMTCDLREHLQGAFGGQGVGWVDCASQVNGFRQTVRHQFTGITEFEVVKRPFNHQLEGIAQRYFTAVPGATMSYAGSQAREHLDSWSRATFYLKTPDSVRLTARVGADTLVHRLVGDSTVQQWTIDRDGMRRITYQVDSVTAGTVLYGAALEARQGVVVDNFSMRGSSGISIADIPLSTLRDFAAMRPYDLIVLQFGLNVANEKSHPSNYKAYTERFGLVIEHLRRAWPEASILVVSMPDRDQRTAAGIRTMNGVEALVAYQQIMAAQHHVAFFNLFHAMGGRESMKQLVEQNLANKDYTHLNFAGGRAIARLLAESIMAGFENYKQR